MSADGVKKPYGKIFQISCIVLLLALLAFILVSETLRMSADTAYVTAKRITLREEIAAEGYLLCEETVLESPMDGARRYAVGDGQSVGVGEPLLLAYPVGEYPDARAVGEVLTAELVFLRQLLAAEEPWQVSYFTAYEALMASLTAGGAADRLATVQSLRAALERRSLTREDVLERIRAVETEFDMLTADVAHAVESVSATAEGWFYRQADGLEGVLSSALAETLTPAGLSARLAAPADTSMAAGKLLTAQGGYLAVPLGGVECNSFTVGAVYEVCFEENGEVLSLTLERVSSPDEDGRSLLLFAVEDVKVLGALRRHSLRITVATNEGIRVPMAAVSEVGGVPYVYVAKEGRAVRRRVETVLYRDGYCLAAEGAAEDALKEGDRIVLTSRRIYEGKALNEP